MSVQTKNLENLNATFSIRLDTGLDLTCSKVSLHAHSLGRSVHGGFGGRMKAVTTRTIGTAIGRTRTLPRTGHTHAFLIPKFRGGSSSCLLLCRRRGEDSDLNQLVRRPVMNGNGFQRTGALTSLLNGNGGNHQGTRDGNRCCTWRQGKTLESISWTKASLMHGFQKLEGNVTHQDIFGGIRGLLACSTSARSTILIVQFRTTKAHETTICAIRIPVRPKITADGSTTCGGGGVATAVAAIATGTVAPTSISGRQRILVAQNLAIGRETKAVLVIGCTSHFDFNPMEASDIHGRVNFPVGTMRFPKRLFRLGMDELDRVLLLWLLIHGVGAIDVFLFVGTSRVVATGSGGSGSVCNAHAVVRKKVS